jgi:hypothetical protein
MDRKNLICIPKTDNSSIEKETEAHVSAGEKVMLPATSQIQNLSISWAYFLFTGACLRALKSKAMSTMPEGNFISTDDVLSVFVCCSCEVSPLIVVAKMMWTLLA